MAARTATSDSQTYSPWPHRLAVALAAATFPMLCFGAMVTTSKAGMAYADWPTTFGYNPFLYPLTTWLWAPWNMFIEHGHRLMGWAVVGPLTIALLVTCWLLERRRWMRGVAAFTLGLVIVQGVIGGLRVVLDDTQLAQLHGCVGPLFFATAVAICVFTSRLWRETPQGVSDAAAGKLQRLALLTTALVYAQLIAGSQLRHISVEAPRQTFSIVVGAHLLLALAVFVHAVLLMVRVLRHYRTQRALSRPAILLGLLVVSQICLGVATWRLKYGWPENLLGPRPRFAESTLEAGSLLQSVITTAHVAMGSLILAVSLVIALRSLRLLKSPLNAGVPLGRVVGGVQ